MILNLFTAVIFLAAFIAVTAGKASASENTAGPAVSPSQKTRADAEKPEPKTKEVTNLVFEERVNMVKLSWELDDRDVDHIEISGKYFNDQHFWRYDGFHRMTRSVELHLDPLAKVELKIQLAFKNGTWSEGQSITATARHKNVVFDEFEGRQLNIYLPNGYDEEDTHYPVIYMHDGQNLFSPRLAFVEDWRIDRAMDRLTAANKIEKCIVVGIWNSSKRAEEYTPFADRRFGGGKAREFSDYVVNRIIPYVEGKYRISRRREDRAVIGSSFGGILSLWMGYTYPHVFSMAGAVSPSLWIADGAMLKDLEEQPKRNIKIWIDQGTGEWSDFTRNAVNILLNKGYKYGEELIYYEVKDAVHNERHWADRVDCPFILFKGRPSGELTDMRLDIQLIRHFYAGPKKYVINPVGTFDNGIWYSLYTSADYSVKGKSKARIDKTGVLRFNNEPDATVTVKYGSMEKQVTIVNAYYEPKKEKPATAVDKAAQTLKKTAAGKVPPEKESKFEKALRKAMQLNLELKEVKGGTDKT